jgi:hypothetical protein
VGVAVEVVVVEGVVVVVVEAVVCPVAEQEDSVELLAEA